MPPRPDRGIALVLVTGLLALGALLAVLFGEGVRSAATATGVSRHARLADLAAASGLEYAGARLWQDPRSLGDQGILPTAANAADDWTCRGDEPPTRSPGRLDNPSYNRGEHWADTGLPGDSPGAYDAGVDDASGTVWTDVDNDGRFSAWTGRLRGDAAPIRFSLRIRSPGACLCVNSGEIGFSLDDHDLDGILNGEPDPDYALSVPPDAYRDPDYVGNVHLANLLDNLGAILALPGPHGIHVEPYAPDAVPASAVAQLGEIETSSLGRRLVEQRPKGGYRDLDAVRQALAPFYAPADIEAVLPYLSTTGEIVPIPFRPAPLVFNGMGIWSQTLANPEARFEFHARIDFNAAPVPVIEAALRHLAHSGSNSTLQGGMTEPFVRLQAGEAKALARVLAAARPLWTWRGLLTVLAGQAADACWQTDTVTAVDDQRLLKQSLILTQFDTNRIMPELFLWRRNALEVPRESAPVGIDDTCTRYSWKAGLSGPLSIYPFPPDSPSPQLVTGIPSRMTTEISLSPSVPPGFRVDAEGNVRTRGGPAASRTRSGEFSRGDRSLLVSGQQEFEPLLGIGPNPSRMTWPGGEASVDASGNPAVRVRTQTRPHFPVTRFDGTSSVVNYPPASLANPSQYRYPRGLGWVGLSARQWRPEDLVAGIGTLSADDITLTLPFNEDPVVDAGGNASWRDNLFDPFAPERLLLPPPELTLAGTCVEAGINLSPDGPQNHTGTCLARWDCGTRFGEGFFETDANGPTSGTIVLWTSVGEGHEHTDGPTGTVTPVLEILFSDLQRFLGVHVSLNASRIRLFAQSGTSNVLMPAPVGPPADEIRETGWRCIAVTMRRVGTETHFHCYVDGTLCNAAPVVKPQTVPPDAVMQLRLTGNGAGRVQDVVFFRRVLTQAEIAGVAAKPLYEESGRYVSPRIAFDAARLPAGATLTGFSWDGFVPEKTRGTITLNLTGYDANDARLADSPAVAWDGAAPAPASFFPPIAGCRKVDFTAEFAANPAPIDLHDDAGNVLLGKSRILRETPILDEFRIFYRAGRPRWTPLK